MNTAKARNRNLSCLSTRAVRVGLLMLISTLLATSAFADNKKTRQQAHKALRSGDFARAEELYRQVLEKDDRDSDARLGLSRALLKQHRLQDAFDHAARVIALNPLSARAHALLGSAILASGDFRLSIEEFRTALTLDDRDAMAIAGLAMVDFYENRILDCVAKLRRAVSIDPGEPDYIFNLGQAAARSERYREAADAYEQFLIIAPRTDAERRARIRGLIEFLRYLGQQSSLYNIGGADRSVLPFESLDNRPILKVRINDSKQTLRFVLDTGSGMSVLSQETARKLGIKAVARGGQARAVGGGGSFEIVYGYLNSLEVGEVRLENIPVYIRQFYDSHNPVDGYLGIAALGRMITSVDYGNRRLTLIRHRSDAKLSSVVDLRSPRSGQENVEPRPGIEVPLRLTSSGFLSGEVYVEGINKPLNFIIDTGATVSVLSQRAAALDEAVAFIQPSTMRVFGAAGVAENVSMALLPKISIGNYVREGISAAVLDLDPINETAGFQQNGILGGNFLRHFRVVFDFQRAIVRFEPLDATTTQKDNVPWETTNSEP